MAAAGWRLPALLGAAILAASIPGCRPAPPDYSDVPSVPLESLFPEVDRESRVYQVKKGDTLSRIAREHGTSVGAIVGENPGLDPDVIRIGQKIVLPERRGR